jgi:hypothetical protein
VILARQLLFPVNLSTRPPVHPMQTARPPLESRRAGCE